MDNMLLQILDCDYVETNGKPTIRIFSKTEKGGTVCVFYEGFLPYFYVDAGSELEEYLKERKEVVSVEKVLRKPAIGYTTKEREYYKITLASPKHVKKLREELTKKRWVKQVFEADILFKYRFLVDHDLGGMRWMEVEGVKIPTKTVKCSSILAKKLEPVEKEGNAPMKFLSIDIECLPENELKPLSPEDKVILVGLAFDPPYRGMETVVIVAKPFSNGEKNVIGVEGEKELLSRLLQIIEEYDPDVITGYNVQGYDLPHLIARLKANKLPLTIGRCTSKPVKARKVGEYYEITIPGRVVVDPYLILRRDPYQRFKRYDLNTVAKLLLGEEKIDIKFREMKEYWNGSREKLEKFVDYVEKDAKLALDILLKRRLLDKFYELCKISGLLLQDVFGGQSKRIENVVLYEFRRRGLLMPCKPDQKEINKRREERERHGLKGAVVLEPERGLHKDAITLVLDFTSLYPNIIRTYNISPDTLVLEEIPEEYEIAPNGAKFVSPKLYRGVFPSILDQFLEKRIKIKKLAKQATGERKYFLNAVQLALKDMANSMYGYTGFLLARLYVLDVANAITAYGRKNLLLTKDLIEKNFEGCKVIYGDTDSVFLKTSMTSLDEAEELGKRICEFVSERLPGTLELDFDKLFKTFLIMTKKRYAGWCFSREDGNWVDTIITKGIETVRRDWCDLVSETQQKVLEFILKKGDVKSATRYVQEIIIKLKRNEIPLEKLTIVKSITKPLDEYEGIQPHVEVAKKIAKRDPARAPKIGDRVSFVIVAGNAMLSKRAEDPEFVKEKNLQLDWDYYLSNQILPAIERILNAVGVTKEELLGGGHQMTMLDLFNSNAKKVETRKETIEEVVKDITLEGWEEFVCMRCKRSYSRVPIKGVCDCGGELRMVYRGSLGMKCLQ